MQVYGLGSVADNWRAGVQGDWRYCLDSRAPLYRDSEGEEGEEGVKEVEPKLGQESRV